MITINDNSVPQINAALLRLNNVVDMDVSKLETNIDKLKSDTSKLQQEIDEITAGTIAYTAGNHINISSAGVISVVDVSKVLDIKRNGVSVGTFTALASNDSTVDILVPTKTSELTNDSDYVVDSDYIHTDNNFTNDFKTGLNSLLTNGTVELYLCETQGWVKNKVARVNVQKEPKRQGYFYIWFKRLNWYYDGTYCTVSFSDDPDTTYSIRMLNAWVSGNYGAHSSCCFGCGVYMAKIVNNTYCYIIPLDFKSHYIPYYGSGVTPTESEDYFKTTPVATVYSFPVNDVIDTADNTIRVMLPTMFINSSTVWYGTTASGSAGSYYGSYNGIPFPATGQLIYQGEYNARRGANEYAHRHITSLDYQGYTEYTGTVNLTQMVQTLFTHPSTLINKVVEVSFEAQVGNYTFIASDIIKSFANAYGWIVSGYVESSGLPVIHYLTITMYSNGNFNIRVHPQDSWTTLDNTRYTIRVYN